MRPKRYIVAAVALSAVASLTAEGALAFEETTIGGGDTKASAAPVLEMPKELPKDAGEAAKGLNLNAPELQLGQTPDGTEVRIPGLGTVGVLPKLDFGLQLLYGANEQKGPYQDKTGPDDVQLRGTIKHRF